MHSAVVKLTNKNNPSQMRVSTIAVIGNNKLIKCQHPFTELHKRAYEKREKQFKIQKVGYTQNGRIEV